MLNKIKNVLKIIISVLIIFNCMKSCAKAWSTTKQDLTDKLEILGQKGVIGEYVYENIDLTNFSDSYTKYAIIIGKGTSGKLGTYNRLYIYMGNGTQIYNSSNDSSSSLYWNWAYSGGDYGSYIVSTGQSSQWGLFKLNDLQEPFYVYTTIPINTRVLTLGAGEEHGGHYFTTPFSFEIATNYSITDYMGYGQTNAFKYSYNNNQWLLGTMEGLEDITEVEFKLINLETNQNIAQCYKTGSISNMRITNSNLYLDSYIVYRDTPYRLYYDAYIDGQIIDSFWYNIVFLERNAVITNGEITSYGSGEDYNIQNQTQQEQNFWQETYEKLFTISGDFVNEKFEDIKQTLNLSGDYESEQAFINLINENNGDFVIGWQSFSTPYFSLSGDSINFSQLERDNIAFQETMRLGTCINRFQPNSIVD